MGYLAAMNRIILFRWIKIIVLLYSLIGIALYYLQERFLFHPEKLEASYRYHFPVPFEELNIPFNTTDTVSMVKFFPADSVRKGVVLYFHGNRENISRYAKFADNFTKNGYEVWMEDYPGYGKRSTCSQVTAGCGRRTSASRFPAPRKRWRPTLPPR